MLVASISCDWKCLKECNLPTDICQNSHTSKMTTKTIDVNKLIERYSNNFLSESIIFAGLEPMIQFYEIYNFIKEFRKVSNDDIVIYTGYNKDEIYDKIEELKIFENIVIKFGRFIKDSVKIKDDVLKIELISNNQYAEKIS